MSAFLYQIDQLIADVNIPIPISNFAQFPLCYQQAMWAIFTFSRSKSGDSFGVVVFFFP